MNDDRLVGLIALLAITIMCVSPFVGVICAYKLKGDGAAMALSGALTSILGFMAAVIFVLWASQFVNAG
ncbi:hypothetical protein QJ48_04225 [Paenibacillus sp. A3]|uniref:hypothetical protein n=1 Tax=Paenibacillus sp. A3 TaxID=1337054 RepID=UPI0006D59B6C|nr:hypothetical protein [Paenibacillus sp. A3]KPV60738.1 hypothetical protein QJ48_04225 [Paenibacillus sp. A3]